MGPSGTKPATVVGIAGVVPAGECVACNVYKATPAPPATTMKITTAATMARTFELWCLDLTLQDSRQSFLRWHSDPHRMRRFGMVWRHVGEASVHRLEVAGYQLHESSVGPIHLDVNPIKYGRVNPKSSIGLVWFLQNHPSAIS